MTAPGARTVILPAGATVTGLLAVSQLLPGDRVAQRYVIRRMLGMGGMGVVYLAQDEQLNIEVALKLLRPELASRPDAFERFRNEVLLARQVSSPHVVRIHDLVQHEGAWLLSMDYVPGRPLDRIIDTEAPLAPDRALNLVRQIALGLAAAHHRGVIHRDLKPANVMVSDDDDVQITDFGVARSLGATGLTMSGMVVGTPEYLSPEQARADPVDGRSDLYALGLILHELLSGRLPYAGGTPAEMLAQRIVRSPPSVARSRSDLPPFAVTLCDRLLDVRPSRRLPSAEAVARAIESRHLPSAALPPPRQLALVAGLAIAATATIWFSSGPVSRIAVPAGPVAVAPAALAVLPGDAPVSDEDADLQLGLVRALAARLSQGGLDTLDSARIERSLRELDIDRHQIERQWPRLIPALNLRQFLSLDIDRTPVGLQVQLAIRDGTSLETLWRDSVTLDAARDSDADLAPIGPLLRRLEQFLQAARPLRDLPDTASIQRLGRISPWDGAASLPAASLGATASIDEGWFTLSVLERDGRNAEAQSHGREWIRRLQGQESEPALRLRALAEYLTGAPEASLELIDALPARDTAVSELRARALIALGRYEDAGEVLQALVNRDPRNVDAWFQLGKAQLQMGHAQTAVDDALTRALVVANRQRDRRMQADITNALGIGYRQLGQLEASIEQFERAASLRGSLDDPRGQGVSLRNLAAARSIVGDFDGADQALSQARKLLEPIGDPAVLADLINDVGMVAEERGDFRAALDAYREALGFRQMTGDSVWVAASLLNVGFAYYFVGEFDNAQVFLQQAEQTYATIDDQAGAIRAHQGLGLAELARGNFARSRALVEQSLLDAETLQMREEQSTALAALAELDRLEGDYGSALRRAQAAASLFESRGDARGLTEMHLLQAEVGLDIGDWDAADAALQTALQEGIPNAEQRAIALTLSGRLSLVRGDPKQAAALAAEALDIAGGAGAAAAKVKARLVSARAQLALGQSSSVGETLRDTTAELERFASLPLRLAVLETRLATTQGDVNAYRDARTLLAMLPAFGAEWRLAATAARSGLPEAERREAGQRARLALQRVAAGLEPPRRERFLAWAEPQIPVGEATP